MMMTWREVIVKHRRGLQNEKASLPPAHVDAELEEVPTQHRLLRKLMRFIKR